MDVKTWPQPRLFLLSALAMFLVGIAMLYGGLLKLGPLAIFASVLLCVFGVIAIHVFDIERLAALRTPANKSEQIADVDASEGE